MESVNVLVASSIGDGCLRQIAAVSPRVKLVDAADLARAERRGDFSGKGQLDVLLADAEVIFGIVLPRDVTARAPKLKWVQMMTAGVDRFLDSEFRESSVIMTTVSGIHGTQISEFILGLMLMFAKEAPLCFYLKQKKQWARLIPAVLRSKTLGIVGLGSIGGEVARLAKAFGMRVLATRRTAKQSGRARNVDMLLPRQQLTQLLSDSDFVVLTLPFTTESDKLIGERELRAMKSTAYLINISRGGIVDEEALIHALEEKWIAGAGLDVFATEPLPADSKLWELPNVIFSPHIAGAREDYAVHATGLFCENLSRYLDGKKMLNVLDRKKGY